jgi:hypothetical protein
MGWRPGSTASRMKDRTRRPYWVANPQRQNGKKCAKLSVCLVIGYFRVRLLARGTDPLESREPFNLHLPSTKSGSACNDGVAYQNDLLPAKVGVACLRKTLAVWNADRRIVSNAQRSTGGPALFLHCPISRSTRLPRTL